MSNNEAKQKLRTALERYQRAQKNFEEEERRKAQAREAQRRHEEAVRAIRREKLKNFLIVFIPALVVVALAAVAFYKAEVKRKAEEQFIIARTKMWNEIKNLAQTYNIDNYSCPSREKLLDLEHDFLVASDEFYFDSFWSRSSKGSRWLHVWETQLAWTEKFLIASDVEHKIIFSEFRAMSNAEIEKTFELEYFSEDTQGNLRGFLHALQDYYNSYEFRKYAQEFVKYKEFLASQQKN